MKQILISLLCIAPALALATNIPTKNAPIQIPHIMQQVEILNKTPDTIYLQLNTQGKCLSFQPVSTNLTTDKLTLNANSQIDFNVVLKQSDGSKGISNCSDLGNLDNMVMYSSRIKITNDTKVDSGELTYSNLLRKESSNNTVEAELSVKLLNPDYSNNDGTGRRRFSLKSVILNDTLIKKDGITEVKKPDRVLKTKENTVNKIEIAIDLQQTNL